MIFDDKEKCLQLAEQLLIHYRNTLGTDCKLRLLQLSENITYLVERTGSTAQTEDKDSDMRRQRAVLRLSRPGYHTGEELQAEIIWMLKLQEGFEAREKKQVFNGITLQRRFDFSMRQPVSGDDGEYLYSVKDQNGCSYYGSIFTYLSGVPLEDIPLREQPIWFERLGEVTALLHKQVRGWKASSKLPRFHWNYETMIGENAIWGDWRSVCVAEEAALSKKSIDRLYGADRMIYEKLQAYGLTEDRYGLIHGDLRGANLLIEGDSLKIIDFDDCGYGWYMQDLAASISFIETEEIIPELIQAWITGYCRQGVLTQADLDMIPTFIMMRRLQLLAWVHSRTNAAPAIAYRERFLEETVELAEKYLALYRRKDFYVTSLEELGALAEACDMEVVAAIDQTLTDVHKAFYIGTGKVEEAREADILLQVVDYSDEHYKQQIGMEELVRLIGQKLSGSYRECTFLIPYTDGRAVSYLNEHAVVYETAYLEEGVQMKVNCRKEDYRYYEKYAVSL